MTIKLHLKSQIRKKEDKNPSLLRNKGLIPAVLYGPKTKNISLTVDKIKLEKIYEKSGESALIDLEIDKGKTIKVLIKEIQKNIINEQIEHIDFYEVDMKKPIEVEIPLDFKGESPAVKELGGTFMKNLDSVQVRCLPSDLIDNIEVDISKLKTLEDDIKVSDLGIPENFEIITQLTAQVANVLAPRKIEEEEKEEKSEEAGEEKEEGEEKEKQTGEEKKSDTETDK